MGPISATTAGAKPLDETHAGKPQGGEPKAVNIIWCAAIRRSLLTGTAASSRGRYRRQQLVGVVVDGHDLVVEGLLDVPVYGPPGTIGIVLSEHEGSYRAAVH